MILDGKSLSIEMKGELKDKIAKLPTKPCLTVIQIGEDPASTVYVNSKNKSCLEVGIEFRHVKFDENVKEQDVIDKINELNNDQTVNGILIQLPIPKHLDEDKLLNLISPDKDVDGLTELSMGKLFKGENGFIPCTALGVMKILKKYDIPLCSNVVIVGRSNLVSKPLGQLLLQENATVTMCHSKTKDLIEHTKRADILISATGKKHLIDKSMVKEDAVVIDVGITRENGKIYGDVLTDGLTTYTPVPGGVGPMTVACLLNNVYESYLKSHM